VRCKSAVFWLTARLLGVFSTGTVKEGFTGVSIQHVRIEEAIGARIGLILLWICIPDFLVHYERSSPFAVLSGTRNADKCTLPDTCPVVL
jgi:hypothetical protein